MRLIDKAPALFITICFVVLYVTVGVEAAMLASGMLALMWVTFGLVILVAAGICAWMFHLLDDGAPAPEVSPARVAQDELRSDERQLELGAVARPVKLHPVKAGQPVLH
jgi:hypothetical protein